MAFFWFFFLLIYILQQYRNTLLYTETLALQELWDQSCPRPHGGCSPGTPPPASHCLPVWGSHRSLGACLWLPPPPWLARGIRAMLPVPGVPPGRVCVCGERVPSAVPPQVSPRCSSPLESCCPAEAVCGTLASCCSAEKQTQQWDRLGGARRGGCHRLHLHGQSTGYVAAA